MKLVRLIKMYLNEMYSTVQVSKHLSDVFPTKNGLNFGGALLSLLFNFALVCAIRRFQVNQVGLKLNVTNQLFVYADDVNMLGGSVPTIKKKTEALVVTTREIGLAVATGEKMLIKQIHGHILRSECRMKSQYKD
jgi:hypothetical protein